MRHVPGCWHEPDHQFVQSSHQNGSLARKTRCWPSLVCKCPPPPHPSVPSSQSCQSLPLRSPASSMRTLGLAFLWQSRPLQPSAHCVTQTRHSTGTPTCTATQLSPSEQPSATTLSTHGPHCTCDSAGPHPVHQSRDKGPRHFERAHSARVKGQSTLEGVHGVEGTHTPKSSYNRTSHFCPLHSLTLTATPL